MPSIGLFYGSSLDNTKEAAQRIKAEFATLAGVQVELFDVARADVKDMERYELLLIGIPTWDIGNLQSDWDYVQPQFNQLNLGGKLVALFGCGDQGGYPVSFQDGLGILGRAARARGAKLVGFWPTAGYDFVDSLGVEGGQFMGLALDNDHQRKQTNPRIARWVRQLIGEFGIG